MAADCDVATQYGYSCLQALSWDSLMNTAWEMPLDKTDWHMIFTENLMWQHSTTICALILHHKIPCWILRDENAPWQNFNWHDFHVTCNKSCMQCGNTVWIFMSTYSTHNALINNETKMPLDNILTNA
jgi:hypothetical protein